MATQTAYRTVQFFGTPPPHQLLTLRSNRFAFILSSADQTVGNAFVIFTDPAHIQPVACLVPPFTEKFTYVDFHDFVGNEFYAQALIIAPGMTINVVELW